MRKKLLSLMVVFLIVVGSSSTYAAASKSTYTEFKFYTARIFVCDTTNNQAVLVNVAPIKNPYSLNQAPHIEYKALPINTGLVIGSKGQNLTLDTVNGYLLDSKVDVLVGKNGYGYKIVYMKFN